MWKDFRQSERCDLKISESGEQSSNAPVDVASKMATVVTSIAFENEGPTVFEPMERNENTKQRRRNQALAAHSDWRSRIERTIQQQPQKLMQLKRIVGHNGSLLDARATRDEAQ